MAGSVNSFPIKVVTANTRFHASEHEEESNLDDSDHACFHQYDDTELVAGPGFEPGRSGL